MSVTPKQQDELDSIGFMSQYLTEHGYPALGIPWREWLEADPDFISDYYALVKATVESAVARRQEYNATQEV